MRHWLVLASLLAAGCGTKPSQGINVRIANIGSGLQTFCVPVTLASTLGFYKDEGRDVTLINLPSNAKTLEALMGGSADAAVIHMQQAMQMAVEGKAVRSFFVLNRVESKVFAVAPTATGRIRRAEDLKGGTLGVPGLGTSADLWGKRYLSLHGIGPEQIKVVGIGLGASALAAAESGRIDAAVFTGGDHLRLMRRHPDLRLLCDAGQPACMMETYGSLAYAGGTVSAQQAWLDRNPDAARRIARALRKTLQWIASHKPEEIRERLPEGFRSEDSSLDMALLGYGLPALTTDGRMPEGAPEVLKRFLDATVPKIRDAKIELGATWTNEYLEAAK